MYLQARTNYGKQKSWIQHNNKKDQGKVEGMVKSKSSCSLEGNEPKNPTDGNKEKYSKTNNYSGEKPLKNPIPDP